MKTFRLTLAIAIAALGFGLTHGSSFAAGTDHFGPFATTGDPDNGSCGPWAIDSFNRSFDVHDNGDGTFRMTEWYKDGTFVTKAGASPGACSSAQHHGSVVNAGIVGHFQGFLTFKITGGSYNPAACSSSTPPASCNDTFGFIATTFPGNTGVDCPSDNATCFNFDYSSSDKSLQYRHWSDYGKNGPDVFNGDIANS